MYKALYAYGWDLADEGLEAALGRIRPCGVTTLTVAASYHAGKFLRPHGSGGKVYFPKDGTVYFKARPERYGTIKPIVNPLVDQFDAFAQLERAAPDIGRCAWVVCLHNTALGERHPEATARNVFGDPYLYSLSPAHEAARDYVVNLCADLADCHALEGLVLETPGWLPYDHGFHHEFSMVPLNPWAKLLLGLDFCDGVIARARAAGIDALRLCHQARDALERFLEADIAVPDARAREWFLADVIADPEWSAFLNWRCRLVAELVAEVRAALPRELRLAVIPTVNRPSAACWAEGSDLAMLAGACDVLEIPAYEASADGVGLDLFDVRRRVGPQAVLHAILRPSFPDLAGGAETAAAARVLRAHNVTGVAFYNYGHIRLASLRQVRAAVDAFEAPA